MMMVVHTFFLCLFEYCMMIFLVVPGKSSFRHFDSVSAYGIGRALLEKRRRGANTSTSSLRD